MLLLLSPAKALDFDTPLASSVPRSQPHFVRETRQLIDVLRRQSAPQVAALMRLSDALAERNVARYQAWQAEPESSAERPAAFAFDGAVYRGLDMRTLGPAEWSWLQDHVAILSGLYGVLRPLDCIQPYRLEMGTRLKTRRGANLYQFWGSHIAEYLDQRLVGNSERVIVDLASREYFKAVDRKALAADVAECVFEDFKDGGYKVIGVHAKRARGLMARWAAQRRAASVAELRGFALEGYAYAAEVSAADRLVFRRRSE